MYFDDFSYFETRLQMIENLKKKYRGAVVDAFVFIFVRNIYSNVSSTQKL
jgi:hypothetical protein